LALAYGDLNGNLVKNTSTIYKNNQHAGILLNTHSVAVRIRCILALIFLMLLDIGPIPITATIGLFVVFFRPRWFSDLVNALYGK